MNPLWSSYSISSEHACAVSLWSPSSLACSMRFKQAWGSIVFAFRVCTCRLIAASAPLPAKSGAFGGSHAYAAPLKITKPDVSLRALPLGTSNCT